MCYNHCMKQLAEDIRKKQFKNIYLLYGSESYLRKRCVDTLVAAFLPEKDPVNCTYFYGRKIDLGEVISLADTMPFMTADRVIVLENTELFSKPCEELALYIPNIPDCCRIIFSEEKIDSRLKQTKAVRSSGCIAEFNSLSEAELRDFIIKRLAKEHRPITQAALDLFIKRCGDDLWSVSCELEKVISYTFGKDGIRPADVEAVCPAPAQDHVFNMIDAVIACDTHKALSYYSDLLKLRSEPLGIMGLIRDQFRLMLHVKELDSENMSIKDMASVLKMRDVRIKMALPAARRSSKIILSDGIALCAETDERIKSGLVDPRIGVETLIVELSQRRD